MWSVSLGVQCGECGTICIMYAPTGGITRHQMGFIISVTIKKIKRYGRLSRSIDWAADRRIAWQN